jgi:energy-converting hydrogenase Eha subunit E
VSVTVPDVYAMNPAVDARNTIYTGYGPTSLTLTSQASGGISPYTYSWSNGQATQSISVNAAGLYTVTITDSNGCTATDSIMIKTLDVRCGNNSNKVKICHNNKTICVAPEAVQDHLAHGDHLGDCTVSPAWTTKGGTSAETSKQDVVVYPNPATEVLNVQLSGVEAGSVIMLYNQNGALVKTLTVTATTHVISVRELASGVYYLQVKNRGVLITRKIVKL